jgi:hypothetical protein
MLSSSAEGLLEQAEAVAPVAAPLADQRAGRGLLDSATTVLPDAERLLVAGTTELSQARAAVERGAAKRSFVKPWRPGEVAAALEDAVRIFELRWLVRTLRARLEASGLGLPLCRELVTGMGGTLSLRSAPGQGTTACIELRLAG